MSRSTFSVLFYVNRGKEKGGTTRLSVSGRVPRHCASIRRRYEMEQEAAMRDSIGRLMIQQSKDIRKKMK